MGRAVGVGAGVRFFTYSGNRQVCMPFYIRPLPKQWTVLELIIHVHIFSAMTHCYTGGINDIQTSNTP